MAFSPFLAAVIKIDSGLNPKNKSRVFFSFSSHSPLVFPTGLPIVFGFSISILQQSLMMMFNLAFVFLEMIRLKMSSLILNEFFTIVALSVLMRVDFIKGKLSCWLVRKPCPV